MELQSQGGLNTAFPSVPNRLCSDNRDYVPKEKEVMVAEALSDLVIYTQSVKFTSFSHASLHQTPYQNTSMGEKKTRKLARASGETTEWTMVHV